MRRAPLLGQPRSVLENFDLLLKFDEFKNILIKDKYLKIFRELFNPSNSELAYLVTMTGSRFRF